MSILVSLSTEAFTPKNLWAAWPEERFVTTAAPCLRHEQLQTYLEVLASRHTDRIQLEEIGQSFLGRPIRMLKLGTGPGKILLWSQMHGDEPSATPALLDIASYLVEHSDDPVARSVLQDFTLLMIPMLNPDGTEVYQRRNAQGIDINRDALQLATPEGRLLKRIRDEYEPMLGFNLHDQNRRTAVGDTGRVANIALLAVSGDAANTITPGRLRTKRANAAIVEALTPLIAGGIARYDEDWSPRAFGDNITAWGTPVILIESGGVPNGSGVTELTRLNFVAILAVLSGLAQDDLAGFDLRVYEDLPHNKDRSWSDVVVEGGNVLQPGGREAFRADLAFDRFIDDRQVAGCSDNTEIRSQIFLVGDATAHGAGVRIDANGSLLTAPFNVGVNGWSEQHWLNLETFSRLARLGVGTIYWSVSDSHQEAALSYARQFNIRGGQGLPQIEVLTRPGAFSGVTLSGPPSLPDEPASLGAILGALVGAESPDYGVALEKLWMPSSTERLESPPLIKNRPASFLVLSASTDGQIDFAASRLISVWLNGLHVTAK